MATRTTAPPRSVASRLSNGLLVLLRIAVLIVWTCVLGSFLERTQDPTAKSAPASRAHTPVRPP
jgi:hypothetical protein